VSLATILGVVFPLLTIIIGGACVLLFSVTSTLRASNGDLRDRVADLEKEQSIDRATIKTQAGEIKTQAAEIVALQKIVTGEVQLTALTDLLEHHHADTIKTQARIEKTVDTLLVELRKAS
jgi:hypothetical protein